MTCDQLTAELVDAAHAIEASPAAADHLAGCPSCRALVDAHRAAQELARIDVVPSLPAPNLFAELGRRRRARVAIVTAGVLGVAILGAYVATRPAAGPRGPVTFDEREPPVDVAAVASTERAPLVVDAKHAPEPSAIVGEPESELGVLLAEVRAFTRRDVGTHDFTYASFGELPRWIAAPRDRSLDLPPFDAALAPIHALQEEVP